MKAYIYRGDIYCDLCAKAYIHDCERDKVVDEGDSEDYPQGPYPDGGGEADCPQHCGDCGIFLENPLTDDGRKYVEEKISENKGDPTILKLWKEFYDIRA